jgi:hypothetical protein
MYLTKVILNNTKIHKLLSINIRKLVKLPLYILKWKMKLKFMKLLILIFK